MKTPLTFDIRFVEVHASWPPLPVFAVLWQHFSRAFRIPPDGCVPASYSTVFCFILFTIVTGIAASPSCGADSIATNFDAVAYVKIQHITHALRPSDIRRVEQGAQPPLVPYKAMLDIIRTVPETGLHRLVIDGLTTSTWMPEIENAGILLLVTNGTEYYPIDHFPETNFLLEETVGGKRLVQFPLKSGNPVPFSMAWDCLCAVLNARKTQVTPDCAEKYTRFLLEGGPEEMATGLFFLLNSDGTDIPWAAFGKRLSASPKNDPKTLSLLAVMNLLAAYASPEEADPALETALAVLPGQLKPADWKQAAETCLQLASGATSEKESSLLEKVLAFECETQHGKQALVQDLALAATILAGLEGEANEALLTRMLGEPARFPALHNGEALAIFWKLLDQRRLPGLPEYLHRFLQEPSALFLGIDVTPERLQKLVRLAKTLDTTTRAPRKP